MMELHELQKMISIIHDKKPRCRGNLRVKVLLKSTHDYVRRSLLDDQLGNSESLLTLLRNSGTVREPRSPVNSAHETDFISMNSDEICTVADIDSHFMDCDETSQCTSAGTDQELQCSVSTNQNMKHVSENIPITTEADNQTLNNTSLQSVVSDVCGRAFRNCNKSSEKSNCNNPKEKCSKLIKALQKIMKHWESLRLKAKGQRSSYKRRHTIKRMRKLLLESKVCFKADFENLSLFQQRLILLHVRVIRKMLKECDRILERK